MHIDKASNLGIKCIPVTFNQVYWGINVIMMSLSIN